MALREASAAPVTGLAESAFIEAAARGRFAGVVTVKATGAELLAPTCRQAARDLGVQAVVLGGAGLAALGLPGAPDGR